ncbi:MlaC/ttg2D family ABC transporter substrate-binding protein [Solilutibacter tolerans]|uniref:Phospholipid transport system substrate-binding protein n=1 Tax=Solilutibacter tolerans TaxID=1604334 RepID=A0A1N6RBQ5_9GAMM|nr:ABC transporter substrate-binding protein [Lysobacter tolerans]SIQ26102.1 phospholipid transport system substrate-binding protein [Lysobacter tolerans]
MNRLILPLAIAASFALVAPVQAQAVKKPAASSQSMVGTPSKLVLDNTTRVLSTLEKRRAEFTKNRGALNAFINSEFNQMFDRDYAARLVLGRHARGAADADVKLFSDALAENLMTRYGSSLLDFNTALRVRIKSETALPGNRGVRVSSEMLRAGGEPIPVDYLMRKVGNQWQVFDVMVEGVSFVQTFRNQFDSPLSQRGIRAVAAELKTGRIQASANR